ncbi:T9SS type A sorting domain-containing protein [Xanthovirga aplysinae]|uniref:T9SS type A sorting domain-containing protein n=1 Tax=Xanthovirga aplysinae TaxID=2529853 RepID=UPI0012BC7B86|nr:T9SS type A sorting domain-containing protein [Xanthovirga aplysinae]MTI30503.1 T9SS type A sorting domain-containing protein [Xanthovirga aplysinae]
MGAKAGRANTEGNFNNFLGKSAGYNNTTGSNNNFLGISAGFNNTTGEYNNFFGYMAGSSNTTGSNNNFLGQNAGRSNSEGHYNNFLGSWAGYNNTTGYHNNFLGSRAGYNNTTGIHNNFFGYRAGYSNSEGSYNIGLGYMANISSDYPVGIGSEVTVIGANSLALGAQAQVGTDEEPSNYAIALGAGAQADCDNCLIIGGTQEQSRISVGIGTTTPNPNTSLELAENNKGLLINRMTTDQRNSFGDNLGSEESGMLVYDIEKQQLKSWNGSAWQNLGGENPELNLSENILSISGGNSVDLSGLQFNESSDVQDLTGATLNGMVLQIDIEGGASAQVDLTPILSEQQALIDQQQALIDEQQSLLLELAQRLDNLEEQVSQPTVGQSATFTQSQIVESVATIEQNSPNPSGEGTTIKYNIPHSIEKAELKILNNNGILIEQMAISNRGEGEIWLDLKNYAAGTYLYSLYTDGNLVETKRMVVY